MSPAGPPGSASAAGGAGGAAWVAVGRVTRAHGIHGEVAVLPLTQVEARFAPGSRLYAGEDAARPLTVVGSRPHRGRLLIAFREVPDRTAAEALAGGYLFVPVDEVPPAPEGEFWPHQLVGCEVVTEAGRSLGPVREVLRTPANDVWVAREEGGREWLVPALKDVVAEVDLVGRRILVREVPGLTAPEEGER